MRILVEWHHSADANLPKYSCIIQHRLLHRQELQIPNGSPRVEELYYIAVSNLMILGDNEFMCPSTSLFNVLGNRCKIYNLSIYEPQK